MEIEIDQQADKFESQIEQMTDAEVKDSHDFKALRKTMPGAVADEVVVRLARQCLVKRLRLGKPLTDCA